MKTDFALAFLRAPISQREQPRQTSPSGAGFGIGEDVGRAVAENQTRAQDQFEGLGAPPDLVG